MTRTGKKTFKIRKPHHTYLDLLLEQEYTTISDRNAGLYYCRLSRGHKAKISDIIGIKRERQDQWLLYKKNPFKLDMNGSKHNFYKKLIG